MNTTKKIHVNFSSLLGLKTELLRKQTEVNTAKLRKTDTVHAVPKLKKKNNKTKENANENTDELIDVDDINIHKKSKLMLEAKSRLYERLKKSKNNNENFLVDFAKKSDESEDELSKWIEDNGVTCEDEDSWVEYKDCFGRTRKCLRRDLSLMRKKDDFIKQQVMNRERIEDSGDRDMIESSSIMIEKEPEIEVMRRKWEEQTQKLVDKADIHYQDILFDEARAHGVGYYAFSQDEEERTKQQENLIKLRKETEQKQKEMKEVKELKERMEQNRLKAARIRKRIRAGLPAEPVVEELVQESWNTPSLSVSQNTRDRNDAKDDFITERDGRNDDVEKDTEEGVEELLGKRTYWYEMSQEEWVDKSRRARIKEFGPIYDNFKSAGYLHIESPENNENCNPSNGTNIHEMQKNTQKKNEHSKVKSSCFFPPKPDTHDQYCEINKNKENAIYENSTRTTLDKHQSDSIDGTAEAMQSPLPFCTTLPHIGNTELTDIETSFQNQSHFVTKPSLNDPMVNCVPDTNIDIMCSSESTIENKTTTNRGINEESIAVGLRYLREQFEESQNI